MQDSRCSSRKSRWIGSLRAALVSRMRRRLHWAMLLPIPRRKPPPMSRLSHPASLSARGSVRHWRVHCCSKPQPLPTSIQRLLCPDPCDSCSLTCTSHLVITNGEIDETEDCTVGGHGTSAARRDCGSAADSADSSDQRADGQGHCWL